jgi:Glycosyltransferase family 87
LDPGRTATQEVDDRRVLTGARLTWFQRIVAAILLAFLVLVGREAVVHPIDFAVYHRAARQVIAGDYELYPAEAYGGQPRPSQGFRYLPAVAFVFVPFGWLSLERAAVAFFALKLAALWYVGVTVARHVGLTAGRRQVLVVAFLVVGGYLVEEFRFGNVHFLCIALLVFAYDRAESGHIVAPAAALALAIATKVTPLALLGYFAIRRRWLLCLATFGMICLMIVLPAVVIGCAGNERQLRAYATYAIEKTGEDDNYSLRGALVRYLTPGHADVSHLDASVANLSSTTVTGLWLVGVSVLGLAGLAAVWREDRTAVVRLLEFSIVMTGIVLASPHTQRRYFVALYVPAVALVAMLARTPPTREKRIMLVGLLATAATATILPLVFAGRRLALLYEATSPYFFGALVLYGVLVIMTLRRKAVHGAARGVP